MELWENFILGLIIFLIRKRNLLSSVFERNSCVDPPHPFRARLLPGPVWEGSQERTTPLSQMTLMRSCTPLTPCGILVKSSLPIAFCLVVKGRWSDATMFRVSLGRQKGITSEGKRPGSQREATRTGKKSVLKNQAKLISVSALLLSSCTTSNE